MSIPGYLTRFETTLRGAGVNRAVLNSGDFLERFPSRRFLDELCNRIAKDSGFELYAFMGMLSRESQNAIVQRLSEARVGGSGSGVQRMFAGLPFMVAQRMCAGVINGELMTRVDPVPHEELVATSGCCSPMRPGGEAESPQAPQRARSDWQ